MPHSLGRFLALIFAVSLFAGHFLLRTPSRRTMLALAVVPIALLRNGFRIFTLGELCVNVDRNIIDSAFHHKGGPIFFALSLVPFLALLLWLRKTEKPLWGSSPIHLEKQSRL